MGNIDQPMGRDWVGLGFEMLRANGEDITISIGQKVPSENEIRWFHVPHSECDGIGAITRVLRQNKLPESIRLGVKRDLRRPAWPRRVSAFYRYLADSKPYRIPWNRYEPAPAGQAGTRVWRAYSTDETAVIRRQAEAQGVSLNSWVLWALQSSIPPRLASGAGSGRWLIPFNLRGAVNNLQDTANHAAFLTVDIQPGDPPAKIHATVGDQIRRDYHWGSWLSLNLIRWVGAETVRKAQAKSIGNGKSWLGTFTNLGVWPSSEIPESARAELDRRIEFLIPFAPTLRVLPISAGCLVWNDRLVLSLHLNPAFNLTQAEGEELLRHWAESVRG